MDWQAEEMSLGYASIDDDHRVFLEKLTAAIAVPNDRFAGLFVELNNHLTQHFAEEERLMAECNFSALVEHRGEHRRILGELNQFKRQVEKGRFVMARSYLKENMGAWFKLHLMTMDSALVAQLKTVASQ